MANNTKQTISQWAGAILALLGTPLIWVLSMSFGSALLPDSALGVVTGLATTVLAIFIFAWITSKIIYWIIS